MDARGPAHHVAADDDDDALFAEMLTLLDDGAEPPHEPQAAPRVPGAASSGSRSHSAPSATISTAAPRKPARHIGSAARRKIAIDALRLEHQRLIDQLAQLRGGDGGCASHAFSPFESAREHAMVERVKRRRAEQECTTLRRALLQQMQFLRGLRGAVAAGPGASLGLNLCHYLHNFTRLPRDRLTRQSEYMALSRAERLDAAIEMLCHETGAISVVDAHLQTDYMRESDERCAASTMSVFTMDVDDVGAVLRATCVAIRDILLHSRPFQNIGIHGEIVDADALTHNNVQYRATSVHKRSDHAEDFSIESLEVTMYRLQDDAAVMLWDFVDEDELEPLGGKPDISRQSVGACLIRREVCPDDVQRVVYRELSMRRYVYRGDAPVLPLSVQQYFASKQSSVGPNELVFRDLMARQIAVEEAHALLAGVE